MEFSFLPSKVHKKNCLVLYVNRMKSRTIDSHQVTRWLCLILPMGDSWPEREVSHPASHSLWAVEPGPQMQVPSCPPLSHFFTDFSMTLTCCFVSGLEWLALFHSLPLFPHPIPVGIQFLAEEKGARCYPCGLLWVLGAYKRLLLFNNCKW